ncbi:MAG: VWA domain-containing protein [Candidatus Hydrogenedentes bacterium]|nr:VWA domain-containing protein [Candidatus Hydrogenedentota bacterium]
MMAGFELDSGWALTALLSLPALIWILLRGLWHASLPVKVTSAALRLAIVVLIVLALTGLFRRQANTALSLVVAADASASVPANAPESARKAFEELAAAKPASVELGAMVFAGDARVVVEPSAAPEWPAETPPLTDRDETAIEGALWRARQMLQDGRVPRVLLLSDGNETRGDAQTFASYLKAQGVRVFCRTYAADTRPEVLVEELNAPQDVALGQSFALSTTLRASAEGLATIALYRDGALVSQEERTLTAGENDWRYEERDPKGGLAQYLLVLESAQDHFRDNNRASALVYAQGKPRVLVADNDERNARYLVRALEAESFAVETRSGAGMPVDLNELMAFDVVVMSGVPATDLSNDQMLLLGRYVEDLGGGLIMLGGEDSFGIGGYGSTPLAEVLPVKTRGEEKQEMPGIGLLAIMDRSGSMQGEKLTLAKEAARATLDVLGPMDQVGVLAFDSQPLWVVEMESAGNRIGIQDTISRLESGGGTYIYPALEAGLAALQEVNAAVKHVILLTDGQSQPGDYQGIVERMRFNRITVSTVAVGDGADTQLLQDIARWGQGRYYFTADPFDIPQIFTRDTLRAARTSIIEAPFLPQVLEQHPVLAAIPWGEAPFLYGYVMTAPKPTASTLLLTERGDPLLATWQYGLGKVTAFTSDASGRWAADWTQWPGYTRFWPQVLRHTMRAREDGPAMVSLNAEGGGLALGVDVVDSSGYFMNALTGQVRVLQEGQPEAVFALMQTGPGHYEARFPAERLGNYICLVEIDAQQNGAPQAVARLSRGYARSYRPEFRHLGANVDFLKTLAESTGGTINPSDEELFAVAPEEAIETRVNQWPWLLSVALLLFLCDVAVRRLDLPGWVG